MSDPYQTLGVPSTATDDEITQAYRKLAKKFHPDLNPGDKTAEARMKSINSAYSQIKDIRSGRASASDFDSGANGQSAGYGSYGYGFGGRPNGGGQAGGWWDPFSDLFGGGWTASRSSGQSAGQRSDGQEGDWTQGGDDGEHWRRQWSGSRQEPKDRYVRAARESILQGSYQQAVNLLMATNSRDAEWNYYCAIANWGVGNRVTALRMARTAVAMDPNRPDYRDLLSQLEKGGYAYRQSASQQGFDLRGGLGFLMQCILFNIICYFCCR